MKTVVLLLLATVSVAGCLPDQRAFDTACLGNRAAYGAWVNVSEKATPNQQALGDAIFQESTKFCENPPADKTEAGLRVAAATYKLWKLYGSIKS